MKPVPLDLLQKVADGKLANIGTNVWKAMRWPSYVQIIGTDGSVLQGVPRLDKVAGFRLTRRGQEALAGAGTNLIFNKDDLPLKERMWVSGLSRLCRNCPKSLRLSFSDGQLHVLAEDSTGQVKDDDAHRVTSMKVPWLQ